MIENYESNVNNKILFGDLKIWIIKSLYDISNLSYLIMK